MSRTKTTTVGATSAASPASAPAPVAGARRGLLRGVAWLVWRQHRAALWTGIAVTAVACAVFTYRHADVSAFMEHGAGAAAGGSGNPGNPGDKALESASQAFHNAYGSLFESALALLSSLPFVAGIFLGAPLIAGEQEHGTVRLATTQSVSRGRWIAAKLGLPLLVVAVCTTLLTVTFTRLWKPVHQFVDSGDWFHNSVFDATGPVPVALALFLTSLGIAVGMVVKRVGLSMAITLVGSLGFLVIWSELRQSLAPLRSTTFTEGGGGPDLPPDAVRIDEWVATADGRLYGYGTCMNDAAPDACRAKLGIVNRVAQYFDFGQMAGMQWLGAGILLAATAAILAVVVWRVRRWPL